MNVLKEMNSLTIKDKEDLEDIYDTLEMKLDSLECSEPESCGETYDRWVNITEWQGHSIR